MLRWVAGLTWRRPWAVLAGALVFAVGAVAFGHDVEHRLKAAGFTDSASESERAVELLRDRLGYDPNPGLVVLLRPLRDGAALEVSSPAVRDEVARLAGELRRVRDVGRVTGPLPARDGRSAVLAAHLTIQDIEDTGGLVAEQAEERLRSSSLRVDFAGFAPGFNQVADQTKDDLTNAELIAFPALTVLLLLVFRGVVAALLPLLIGVLSIVGTFFVLRVMTAFVDTSIFALNVATALSLGLAVDYALLIVSRWREETGRLGITREAHVRTVVSAGRAAMFSGLTVAVAMAALVVMPQRFLYSIGAAGAAVGVLSALCAVLVLPALLRVLGPRVEMWSIRRGPAVSSASDRWHRLAAGVMRRPVLVGGAAAVLLLACAAPLTGAKLTGPSAEVVPPALPAYEPQQVLTEGYPRGVIEAVTVVVRGGSGEDVLRAARGVPGVDSGGEVTRAGDLAFTTLGLDAPALSGRAQDAVRAIRDLDTGGGELLVAGNTARFLDLKESLVGHAWIVALVIAGGTLALLFALTGSVLLPLKTLVMNGLTLAATLGIMVLAFQEGWLRGVVDDSGPQAIETVSLVFLFAVTFALATDYAVLVMARIKEHHDRGMSNTDAVASGIAETGRIISAAAVMIAVVFLAFAVSPVFFMKQIAVGMALGVIIDATIVRALLVPALMRLLGERNWWAPAPLRALHRRVALREA